MNKKLICLLLSVLMLMSVVLTSCRRTNEDDAALDDISSEASASAVTLAMYLMSESAVSAEQEAAIEKAVNDITKNKFKAKVDITYLTPDTYYTVLEENLKKQAENADLYFTDEEDVDGEPETEKNEYGIETLKYPALKPNQVDIFYFSGYDKYISYYNEDYLNSLGSEVDGDAKALNSYLTPALLSYMRSVNGGLYAIPTNRPLGEYTYLLLNKEVLKTMYYDTENSAFTSLTCENVQDILSYVVASGMTDDYVPLHSYTGELDVLNYQYWGVGENGLLSNKFSVLGGAIDPTWVFGAANSYSPVNNIFDDPAFMSQLSVLNSYKQNGYYDPAAVAEGKPFAVGYVKGGAELIEEYGDMYELVPVAMPTLYTQDLYEHMFGVSAYSIELGRSMDIITYLNTNEEFRNLILYGIEGENYEIIESSVCDANGDPYKQVKMLPNNTYHMDINKTGNTQLAYTMVGESPLLRVYTKQQNHDLKPAYSMGLSLDYDDLIIHAKYFQDIRKLSETMYTDLMNKIENNELTEEYLSTLSSSVRINGGMAFSHMMDVTAMSDTINQTEGCSFMYLYFQWLEAKGLYIPPKEDE